MRRPPVPRPAVAGAWLLAALPLLTAAAAPPSAGGGAPVAPVAPAGPVAAPRLVWPIACELGRTCFIQRYLDRDGGPGARDYTCGSDTQDKHGGTDIRLRDMADQRRGVDVLAAAAGTVLRLRDGEPDLSVRERGAAAVKGTECGNGVVVSHGDGWETQYCHMARGSLVVRPGQVVRAGQPLGRVGLSGETEFAHLHFSLSRRTVAVDPFAPAPGAGDPAAGGTCGSGASLWLRPPPYAGRQVINTGFTDHPVDMAAIEAGGVPAAGPDAPYLVAYVRTTNLRPGDVVRLTLSGPGGVVLAPGVQPALTTVRQQGYDLVGKRRPAAGWPKGTYRGELVVENAGRPVLTRRFETTL